MESRQNLIRLTREIASSRGHKLGDFQIISLGTSFSIDFSKIPTEKIAEMKRNEEAGRFSGWTKMVQLELDPEDFIEHDQGSKAHGIALLAECIYCRDFVVILQAEPTGPALEKNCPGKPRPGSPVPRGEGRKMTDS